MGFWKEVKKEWTWSSIKKQWSDFLAIFIAVIWLIVFFLSRFILTLIKKSIS